MTSEREDRIRNCSLCALGEHYNLLHEVDQHKLEAVFEYVNKITSSMTSSASGSKDRPNQLLSKLSTHINKFYAKNPVQTFVFVPLATPESCKKHITDPDHSMNLAGQYGGMPGVLMRMVYGYLRNPDLDERQKLDLTERGMKAINAALTGIEKMKKLAHQ